MSTFSQVRERISSTGCSPSEERQAELQLLSAVLGGDRQATRRFVARYNSTIEARVRRVLGRTRCTEEDVQDMVSEIWVSLLDNDMRPLRRFNPHRCIKVSTWIGVLARNKTIDRLRTARNDTVSLDDERAAEPRCAGPLPQDVLERKERRAIASDAFRQLNAEERGFMRALYVEDAEPETLARRYNIALTTVYTRRFKIQAKLARAVKRINRPRPLRTRARLPR